MGKRGRFIAILLAFMLVLSGNIHTVFATEGMEASEATTEASEEVTTGVPEETTTGVPEETTTGVPEETTTDVPEETTTGAPEETTTGTPEETTTGVPEETTTGVPEETTTEAPEETTTAAPEEESKPSQKAESITPSVDKAIKKTAEFILKNDTNPDSESTWFVLSMVRSGVEVPQSYKNKYYKNVVKQLVESDWEITKTKYSEYSKLIVGLTAIGKDATDIAGHNMLSYLSDFTNVKRQGFNGTLWALLALNSHDSYTIPVDSKAKEQTTEEGLIQTTLKAALSPGGWALYGSKPDPDMTGMAIQALSSYYGKRSDVTAAIDRAVDWLGTAMLESGGYETIGTETAESAAQVITALCAVGVDCEKDERFIKNGKWPLSGLMQYYLSNGSFEHSKGGGYNGLATAQSMYALVSYKRMLSGSSFTYHMSDITLKKGTLPKSLEKTEDKKEETEKETGKNTEDIKASGTTKKLDKLTLSNSKKNTAKTEKTETKTTGKTDQNGSVIIKENTGWSFDGAEYIPEYVPETGEEASTEAEADEDIPWLPKGLSSIEYMALGGAAVLLLEAILFFIYKILKKRNNGKVKGEENNV